MTENEYLAEINAELATVGVKPCATLAEARRTYVPANSFEVAVEQITRTGNGPAVRYADSATEAQIRFLDTLAREIAELNGVEAIDLTEQFAKLSKRQASEVIEEYKITIKPLRERKWAQERAEREAARKAEVKRVGQVNESTGRVDTRRVRGREVDWPVTYVTTRRQRIARKLWG